MNLKETTLESKYIHMGRIINLREDKVLLPDNKSALREVVEHNGGVCVVAVNNEREIYLVNQFRYPYKEILTEIPAGKLGIGENTLECAKRELYEETGIKASEYIFLGEVYPSPGFCNEVLYIYLAINLTFGTSCPDEDEFLDCISIPFERAFEKAVNGEFKDAKTVIGILRAKNYLKI